METTPTAWRKIDLLHVNAHSGSNTSGALCKNCATYDPLTDIATPTLLVRQCDNNIVRFVSRELLRVAPSKPSKLNSVFSTGSYIKTVEVKTLFCSISYRQSGLGLFRSTRTFPIMLSHETIVPVGSTQVKNRLKKTSIFVR